MKFTRILPDRWAKISCPSSRRTLNKVAGNASVTVPDLRTPKLPIIGYKQNKNASSALILKILCKPHNKTEIIMFNTNVSTPLEVYGYI
ncbi:MAG: hypothetical protein A3A80_01355 [Candidatus Terrybacteria bacterium RIFCSPLOWO2_01_FULL_44_24]|uniref:Uncharacterized protein n=1 Tax=Candidatus Terrybacteria bacterium RIFCSPHIGHO2_01_FULL_43_35 TaxID=1802361 RepID=A0A1G2PFF0_9BACT|nr:MAG: hypothetical protein A2828_03730 [Candidatus Terrybacteria bacterium RIFCSPHIGHO2_01_FULL_43_35]OHA49949.1 MAG: hypothetical protein A3B75_03570 [Candidatus Terrybacteria bacterium RIFCSPHIGHO2_02_FULL_43_14]OHA51729.1 MAG: hypothetical protein A3A80_01355 [Candidatus Terrybacteria bacterium RIFCSPLOWO2_01_FULL_44_24]